MSLMFMSHKKMLNITPGDLVPSFHQWAPLSLCSQRCQMLSFSLKLMVNASTSSTLSSCGHHLNESMN